MDLTRFQTDLVKKPRQRFHVSVKSQSISECLFGVLNLPTKILTNFCPLTSMLLPNELSKKKLKSGQMNKVKALSYKSMIIWAI